MTIPSTAAVLNTFLEVPNYNAPMSPVPQQKIGPAAAAAAHSFLDPILQLPDMNNAKMSTIPVDDLPNFTFDGDAIPTGFENKLREGLQNHFLAPDFENNYVTVTRTDKLTEMHIVLTRSTGTFGAPANLPYLVFSGDKEILPGVNWRKAGWDAEAGPLIGPKDDTVIAINPLVINDITNETNKFGFTVDKNFYPWDLETLADSIATSLAFRHQSSPYRTNAYPKITQYATDGIYDLLHLDEPSINDLLEFKTLAVNPNMP